MSDEWIEERVKSCEEATRTLERMTVLEVIRSNENTILCPRFQAGKEIAEIRFVGPSYLMQRLYNAMKGMKQG